MVIGNQYGTIPTIKTPINEFMKFYFFIVNKMSLFAHNVLGQCLSKLLKISQESTKISNRLIF